MKKTAFICLTAIALAASVDTLAAPPEVNVRVGVRPPPMRVERVPAARPGYVWGHGYWEWRGGAHVWIEGGWIAERPGYHYVDARWVFVDGAWAFYPAYWEPYPVVAPAPVVVAPVVVQQAPTTYIERPQTSTVPAGMDPNYWYYCQNPAGYYPYVQQCSGAWQQVTPTPPQPQQ